jgi:hypothetical protein
MERSMRRGGGGIVLVSIANDKLLIDKLLIHQLLIGEGMIDKGHDRQANERQPPIRSSQSDHE